MQERRKWARLKVHEREGEQLRVELLGGFRVETPAGPVVEDAWQRRSARTLVKLLAVVPTHRLHREQVLDLLWPELDPTAAANALYKALHGARRALEPQLERRGESRYLRLVDDSLVLSEVWIDADAFEEQGQAALESGELGAIERALGAYGGELLPEDRYEDWAAKRRELLTGLAMQLRLRLADVLERRGAYGPAAEQLQGVLGLDATHEAVHRRLMRLYVRAGSRHAALRQYHLCREALATELDAEPEAETEALYQELLAGRGSGAGDPHRGTAVAALPLPPTIRRRPPLPFISRELTLEVLLDELGHAAAGEGGVVLVGGEAGVGKTRLVVELARRGHRDGVVVLWGAGYEQEGMVTYGPFVEAIEGYVLGLGVSDGGDERAAVAAAYPELGRLIPALGGGDVPTASGESRPEVERSRLFGAVARLLGDIGTTQPVLLVLDDLHLADSASLQLLHYLARLAPERRWLIVGTYREEDVAERSPFQALSVALTREELCRRIDLLRLAREDCDRLAGMALPNGVPGEGLRAHVYRLSLGNPLYALQLVRTLYESGGLVQEDGRWELAAGGRTTAASSGQEGVATAASSVPRQVRELVLARVDRMDEAVGQTLALGAVMGMEFSFPLLDAAARALPHLVPTGGPLLDTLDQALSLRLLEEQEEAFGGFLRSGYAFRHPLVRAALYDRLSSPRRAEMHAAVAHAIERWAGIDDRDPTVTSNAEFVELLAHHYGRGMEHDRAVIYLESAGDRAVSLFANEAAKAYYHDAAERFRQLGDRLGIARAREKLGGVLTIMARYDEALSELEAADEVYRQSCDHDGAVRSVARMGRVYALQGETEKGIARLDTVCGDAPDEDVAASAVAPTTLALLHVTRSRLLHAGGRYEECLDAIDRAVVVARFADEEPTNRRVIAEAEARRGNVLYLMGRRDAARAALERAVPLAEALDDLTVVHGAQTTLGEMAFVEGRLEAARDLREHALRTAQRLGDPAIVGISLSNLGCSLFYLGRWTEARAELQRALEMTRPFETSWFAVYPMLQMAELYLATGEWDRGRAYMDQAAAIGRSSGDIQALRFAEYLLAELDLLAGNPDGARDRLEPLLDRPGLEEEDVTYLLPVLAQAHLEAGDVATGDRLAAESVRRATGQGSRLYLVDALRVTGMARDRLQRNSDAKVSLDEALALARAMSYPYGAARVLREHARMYAHHGEWDAAARSASEALVTFRELGALPEAERTERDLAALAVGSPF